MMDEPLTPAGSRWIRRENDIGRKYWQNSETREKTFKRPPLAANAESLPGNTTNNNKSGASQLVKGSRPISLTSRASMFAKHNIAPTEAAGGGGKQVSQKSAESPKDYNSDVV